MLDKKTKGYSILFKKRISAGFTLVETIVVITVAVVVAIVGTLCFDSLFSKRLQTETRKIIGTLNWVRETALTTNKDYCITFNTDNYDVYKIACGAPANLLNHYTLGQVTIGSPGTPFNVTFYAPSPTTAGGTAFSSASVSGELLIRLNQGSIDPRYVRVFEDTGYARME